MPTKPGKDTNESTPKRKLGGLDAELIVAAQLVEYGWNIYSPHRDMGFDFIATHTLIDGSILIRPVQVRARFPENWAKNQNLGKTKIELSQWHDEMCLAMPFFAEEHGLKRLVCIAWMPWCQLRKKQNPKKQYSSCLPAQMRGGLISPREHFTHFFDKEGILAMADANWKNTEIRDG